MHRHTHTFTSTHKWEGTGELFKVTVKSRYPPWVVKFVFDEQANELEPHYWDLLNQRRRERASAVWPCTSAWQNQELGIDFDGRTNLPLIPSSP